MELFSLHPGPCSRRFRASRRRGITLIYTTLGVSVFMGVTALVVDMGHLYTKRAQAQRAADAAALAAAAELKNGEAGVADRAYEYAKLNGYDKDAAGGSEVDPPLVTASILGGKKDKVRVTVRRRESLFFLPAIAALLPGDVPTSSVVGAGATAQVDASEVDAEIKVFDSDEYGLSSTSANFSIFGTHAFHEYGDPYSPVALRDGSPNVAPVDKSGDAMGGDPRGADASYEGYTFALDISDDYVARNNTSEVQLEIFDPDTNSDLGENWDEIRTPQANKAGTAPTRNETRTRYQLFRPDGKTLIAEAEYGYNTDSNMKWTTPTNFTFDTARHGGPGKYIVRVKALDGSSENGFNLRAGRPTGRDAKPLRAQADEAAWKADYDKALDGRPGNGTTVGAIGKVPINFSRSGEVTIRLGFVPAKARGGHVTINKYDTDVGAQTVTYSIRDANGLPLPFPPYTGTLASNGQWGAPPDRLPVPAGYPAEGAYWYATYVAGQGDTSAWKMSYTSPTEGSKTANVRLVD